MHSSIGYHRASPLHGPSLLGSLADMSHLARRDRPVLLGGKALVCLQGKVAFPLICRMEGVRVHRLWFLQGPWVALSDVQPPRLQRFPQA